METISEKNRGILSVLAKGAIFSTLGSLTGRGVDAVTEIVFARLAGPAIYGIFTLGAVILRLGGIIASLGLGRSMIAYGVRFWKKDSAALRKVFFVLARISAGWSVLLAVTIFLFSSRLAGEVFHKPQAVTVIQVFALMIPLQAAISLLGSATTITRDVRYMVFSNNIFMPLAGLVLFVLFYMAGWRLEAMLAAVFFSMLGATILLFYNVGHLFPEIRHVAASIEPKAGELFTFAIASFGPSIFGAILPWADRLVLAFNQPASQVGIYQAASQFSLLFELILTNVSVVFSPMVVDLYQSKQIDRLNELYKVNTKWAFYIAIPLSIVTLLAPQLVLAVIFGGKYIGGALALRILTLGQLINVGTGPVGGLLLMTDQPRWVTFATFLGFIVSINLNFLLAPQIGIAGAAVGTLIGLALIFSIEIFVARIKLRLWPYDRRYLKGLLAGVISAMVVSFLLYIPVASQVLHLTLVSFGALAGFVLPLWLLRLDDEDMQVLTLIFRKFSHIKR